MVWSIRTYIPLTSPELRMFDRSAKALIHEMAWATRLMIDGRLVEGQGPLIEVENPATEQTITSVQAASPTQVDEAVAAARRAFRSGVWTDGELRRRVLLRLA